MIKENNVIRHPRTIVGVFLGASLLVVSGLGLINSANGSTARPEPTITTAEAASRIETLQRTAPPEQAAAVADGSVTGDEYRAAIEKSRTCITDALGSEGTVTPAVLSADGFEYRFSYSIASASATPVANGIGETCYRRYVSAVEGVFHLQRKADAKFVQATARQMAGCLRAAGAYKGADESPSVVLDEVIRIVGLQGSEGGAATGSCMNRFPSVLAVASK